MKRSSQDLDTEELDTEELDTEEPDAEKASAMSRLPPPHAGASAAPRAPLLCQRAGVLLLGRVDDVKRFVRGGDRRPEREEVPLVLGLTLGFDRERIGFLHQLMIPRAEITLAALQDVELRLFLEILDQLFGVGRFGFVHGLRHDLERDVFDPGMVLRRLLMLLGE